MKGKPLEGEDVDFVLLFSSANDEENSTMPRNPYRCNKEVKDLFPQHTRCTSSKSRPNHEVTGSYLNQFLHYRPLNRTKKYCICQNMKNLIESGSIEKVTKEDRESKHRESILQLQRENALPIVSPAGAVQDKKNEVHHNDREDRLRRRILIREKHKELKDVATTKDAPVNDSGISNSTTTQPPLALKSKSTYIKFHDQIETHLDRYRYPYKKLKWKKRLERIDEICSHIISVCVDKQEMKRKGGLKYIERNDVFANECMNIFNGIKERLSFKLGVNLPKNDDIIEAIPLVEDDESNIDSGAGRFDFDTAFAILGESTGRGYERIRAKLNNPDLPSLYKIDSHLPAKVEDVSFDTVDDSGGADSDGSNTIVDTEFWDMLYGRDLGNVKNEGEALQIFSKEPGSTTVYGSKLVGGMQEWMDDLMINKIIDRGSVVKDGEDVLLLNCFDGAESIKTEKELKGVISFSSQMLFPSLVQKKEQNAGSSFNILTWMQLVGKEELSVLQPCMKQYLADRREVFEGRMKPTVLPNSKVWTYDVHDGKFLYLITQHSMWNRKNQPFLMCKCRRGNDKVKDSRECCMWDDDAYLSRWNVSQRKWDTERGITQDWNIKKHKDWCDARNFGITHFGMDPKFLPISTIRFDTFHLSCAIIRKMMSALRKFMLKQSSELITEFTDNVLRTFLSNYFVYCWNNKLSFSIFKGNDLFLFVSYSEVITTFIKENLVETEETRGLSNGLALLQPICKFLTLTYIDSEEEYKKTLNEFKENVKVFYDSGKLSYLREDADETFYFHCLRYYMPEIAEVTYKRHKLGVGIFTMQGFERRNKESKNTIRRFSTSNRKSKGLLNNILKRLLMVFYNEMNAF